jgi:multiple sugar transport system substrate-binding protein
MTRATTTARFGRRGALLAGAAALAAPAVARAQAPKFVVVSHAVHRNVATGEKGGDSTAPFRAATGRDVEWLTFGVEAVNERAFREASLAQGSVDVCFILDRFGGPQIASLLEDLGEWQKRDPIEGFDEISAGMRLAHTHRGKLIGIPYRHATHGLFINDEFAKERGLAGHPKSFEEIVAWTEKLTWTRGDGGQVAGFVTSMDDPSGIIDIVRAHGGEFITPEYRVVCDEPGAVAAVTLLREMFRKRQVPRNLATVKTEDIITLMQQGRVAITNQPYGRFVNYNDPKQSNFAGRISVVPVPMAAAAGGGPAPAKTSVWAMAIPSNARDKAQSWQFIKALSGREPTIAAAINGNGPVRSSAYADPRVRALVPYAEAEAATLPKARLVVPGFANSAKAMDVLMEEAQAAILGVKEPLAAMREAKRRCEPLMPA